jgi:hypothetical protein
MTEPSSVYSFQPWLRRGIANQITTADPDPTVKVRPRVEVQLAIQADVVGGGTETLAVPAHSIALHGPGDVVGIDRKAIIRVEPAHWTTNFEPNYLPHVEFYDEDFPWRYTPAAPTADRLRPWLTLLALAEGEFTDGADVTGKPLPYIDILQPEALPPAEELWAWAHVHVNRDLAETAGTLVSTDTTAVGAHLTGVLAENADLAYSRLVCPRKLAPNTAYHAFLIPTFETGRLAGLGEPIGDVLATRSAWGTDAALRFPVYHRWFFRTGASGDFETLVRLLQPRPVDRRVGVRDLDVTHPGSGVSGMDKAGLGGVLRLGGALRPPPKPAPEPDPFEEWDSPFPQQIQQDLARLVNLPDDYRRDGDPDPVVTPPLYGRWHALTQRVLTKAAGGPASHLDNWVHRLNLDPRFRAAAGLGTRVVQEQQEKFMRAAWEQVGQILEAQRRIRLAQFGVGVSLVWYDQSLLPALNAGPQRVLQLLAPLSRRLVSDGVTNHQILVTARVQPVLTSAAMRRMTRPRGRLMRGLPFDAGHPPGALLERVNSGEVPTASPKVAPAGVPTFDAVADRLAGRPDSAMFADAFRETNLNPGWVDGLPGVANFHVFAPHGEVPAPQQGKDSEEAVRFKQALHDEFAVFVASAEAGKQVPKLELDLPGFAKGALDGVNPGVTIPRRVRRQVGLPQRIIQEIGERLVEPMAYPVIDLPMYEPLKDISTELFLPNLNLIEANTITLLETNQRFIEAYLVGLNHEFARELLWREYPTDQRGSTFRQFWDVRGFLKPANADPEALKEKLRDIPPLHTWSLGSALGDHDNRDQGGPAEQELVLVIRGELLRRYPNAVVYAHRARWQTTNGTIDPTQERRLVELATPDPQPTDVRTPLYQAKIDPDIYFLGFDLTAKVARGGSGMNQTDEAGWFFVLKERPGEPRFGLDNDQQPIAVWNDLSWPDVQTTPGGYLQLAASAGVELDTQNPPGPADEKFPQYSDDLKVVQGFGSDLTAAELAYILFQAPVLVGVHASEMLPG